MTLLERARKGLTPEIEAVAAQEGVDSEMLRKSVAAGRAVIPLNIKGRARPIGIGEGLRVKVNVNLGTSADHIDVDEELEKVKIAERFGAHAVMDLSTGGDIDSIRGKIASSTKLPLGTV
ncbi:MAG TPA: phosphomethylpyrimidine synthase, partial [Euryarchaeota archaeon]|nr:phosphomethylpyrimidine synthase [Euryarchaeota archaeon]